MTSPVPSTRLHGSHTQTVQPHGWILRHLLVHQWGKIPSERAVMTRRASRGTCALLIGLSLLLTGPSPAQAGQPYEESGGQVVIEAEHFDVKTPRSGFDWIEENSLSGYSGIAYLTASPNSGKNNNTGYTTKSPELIYNIQFETTGTYYVWIRGYGASGSDDSIHAGIDSIGPTSADRISFPKNSWVWNRNTMDSSVATIVVPTIGLHTFHLWMREDGFRVDKILLRTSSSSTAPSGTGPAESPQTPVDPPPATDLITNISASTTLVHERGLLKVNAAVYTDRTYVFTVVPTAYANEEFIRTPNNDKFETDPAYLTFTLTDNAAVYVAYDARATVLPAWLDDGTWMSTGDTVQSTDTPLNLYRKVFSAGSVTLGGNRMAPSSGAGSNYVVIAIVGSIPPPPDDTIAPVISNVSTSDITETQATISWQTNEPANGLVDYGTTAGYGNSATSGMQLTSHNVTLTGLLASTTYHYRINAVDASNNASNSSDTTFTTNSAVDTTPPTGSITINGGASATNNPAVILTLSASDTEGSVALVQRSNDGVTFSAPEPYSSSLPWTLSGGDGTKTVHAKFADDSGNWSDPAIDSIDLDTTPPAITIISPTDGQVFTSN